MAYGVALGVSVPTVGVTEGPEYATTINAFLTALQTVVEQKVHPGDMDVNADLSFLSGGTYYRAKDLKATSFTNAGALDPATFPRALYFSGTELYVNDGGGNDIQITSSGALNFAAVGGITGSGYGSGGVEVNWDSGDLAYDLYSSAGVYADLGVNQLKLYDNSSNSITVESGAISADYTLTLPAAVPATNNTVLAMATTGAVTATATPTVTTLATTGAATVGSTLGVTGLITATAGLTAAANQHVTVSGTGRFKHGTLSRSLHGNSGAIWSGTPAYTSIGLTASAAGDIVAIPIPMEVGERITSVTFWASDASGATFWRGNVRRFNADGTSEIVGGDADSSTGGTGVTSQAVSGLTETVVTGVSYAAVWTSGANGDRIFTVEVGYDRP